MIEAYDPYNSRTTVKLSAGGISTPEILIEDFVSGCESVSGHLRGTKKTKIEKVEGLTAQAVAVGQLRSFIERIERLKEEKKTVTDDVKEVYAELKGSGFDSKAVRTIIRLRKKRRSRPAGRRSDASTLYGRARDGMR
jgi:uncharacterized protein (UPF0335 family)